jgi:hypothetical protein
MNVLLDEIISIIITAIVVGVPFAYGASKKIEAALAKAKSQHDTEYQDVLAGLNALIAYVKANPTEDKALLSLIEQAASVAGIKI